MTELTKKATRGSSTFAEDDEVAIGVLVQPALMSMTL